MANPGKAVFDLEVDQGATFSQVTLFTDNATPPVPFNWTGYTAKLQVKQYRNSADTALLTLTNGSGITLTSTGYVTVDITATQTGGIPAGTYQYDLEVTQGSTVYRIWEGAFVVNGQVTV